MDSKTKMIMAIALALGIISVAFLAAPIQAYVNGTGNGDLLQTQDQDRLRTQDCNCSGDMLQVQERERLRTQDCDCDSDCTQTQHRDRQRANECATNKICNCTMNLEQYRYQYRERTRS
ncbi:MAG: hypothetical protein OEX06_04095 [Candidatus Bathyarchaeota archaeon]|nr:hypothetical protein [Candidatus Bathyarchaeota archaeon]